VIGNSAEEEAKSRPLRLSALALSCVMAPLAVVAAISTWLRIDQHGFTPERLWALVFVLVVLAVSMAYVWTVIRGRADWAGRVRPANVRLAIAICAVAALLATPLVNFGAIATRDQIARLEAGKIKPDAFDWAALRFDFGPEGRRALERLAREGAPPVRQFAAKALAAKDRWKMFEEAGQRDRQRQLERSLRVVPRSIPVPPQMREELARTGACSGGECFLLWDGNASEAFAVSFRCPECETQTARLLRDARGQWSIADPDIVANAARPQQNAALRRAVAAGRVEVRTVPRRQVFIDGRPVGQLFE